MIKEQEKIKAKEQSVNEILQILKQYSIEDAIEILGNTFIEIGTVKSKTINVEDVNRKTIYKIILDDVKKHGDNITNSLVRQGLLILSWLNKDKI
ncbi:MAG: hypothetical protein CMF69_00590 [Magnetovibrio sp.]|nr:hypothetical protein [Magnetovibrio sp.]